MRIMNILCYFKIQKNVFQRISKFQSDKYEDKGKSNLAKSPKACISTGFSSSSVEIPVTAMILYDAHSLRIITF